MTENFNKIFLQKGLVNQIVRQAQKEAESLNIPISWVPVEKLNRLTGRKDHGGVYYSKSPIQFRELEALVEAVLEVEKTPLILLLDEITDTRNFGAILRTAECTGVKGVIIPNKGSAAINETTVKTSTGAVYEVPICKVSHLKDAIYYLKSSGFQIIAATEKSDHMLYQTNFQGPTALVMGAEDKGIHPSLLKLCDLKVKIPLLGKVESLNVSVASAVVLYEIVRQKLYSSFDSLQT